MYRYKTKIIKVVDGDTVDAEVDLGFHVTMSLRFRLSKINAPETRTRDMAEKELGIAAKNRLKELIDGKEVYIESHKSGKFGRWLAEIYVDDVNINQLLLEEGTVLPY